MNRLGRGELRRRWERTGWCVAQGVIPDDDLAAAQAELRRLFPSAAELAGTGGHAPSGPGDNGSGPPLLRFPFGGDAVNGLVMHDRVVDLAETFLGTNDLRLYQAFLSAKYHGASEEYEQLLHADYGNHTLLVPRHDPGFQQVAMFVYLSDVTADTAATRMVSRRLTGDIPVERTYLSFTEYPELYAAEVPAVGPAGSVLVYRPDTFHRGVAPTGAGAARFIMHVAYKPAATDWLGYQSWPAAGEEMAWHRFVPRASVRQLALLGFPPPGHPYWTPDTLDGVSARYPGLDMSPWRAGA